MWLRKAFKSTAIFIYVHIFFFSAFANFMFSQIPTLTMQENSFTLCQKFLTYSNPRSTLRPPPRRCSTPHRWWIIHQYSFAGLIPSLRHLTEQINADVWPTQSWWKEVETYSSWLWFTRELDMRFSCQRRFEGNSLCIYVFFFSSKINTFSQKMDQEFYRETFQPFLILLPNANDVLQLRLHVALEPRIHTSAL